MYAATKAALHAFSLELNKELAPIGIDVVLCEGGVGGRTPMFTSLVDGVAQFGPGDGAYGESSQLHAHLPTCSPRSLIKLHRPSEKLPAENVSVLRAKSGPNSASLRIAARTA